MNIPKRYELVYFLKSNDYLDVFTSPHLDILFPWVLSDIIKSYLIIDPTTVCCMSCNAKKNLWICCCGILRCCSCVSQLCSLTIDMKLVCTECPITKHPYVRIRFPCVGIRERSLYKCCRKGKLYRVGIHNHGVFTLPFCQRHSPVWIRPISKCRRSMCPASGMANGFCHSHGGFGEIAETSISVDLWEVEPQEWM